MPETLEFPHFRTYPHSYGFRLALIKYPHIKGYFWGYLGVLKTDTPKRHTPAYFKLVVA